MKKTALKFTIALGLVAAAAGSAWAQMGAPAASSSNPMAGMANSIASSIASGMVSNINQQVTSNVSMDGLWAPDADQAAQSAPAPTLDIRNMIEQAIQNMPQQQRDSLAQQMTQQNLAIMQQGSAAANQIRAKVRDTIMMDRYRNISGMAPNLYRGNIQPQMVQTIIGSIKPWELPNRFKSQMMPKIVTQVSNQVKGSQIAYMQEGIGANSFPNIPGLPGASGVSDQVKQQQMQFMQDGVNDPNFVNPQMLMGK